MTWEVVEELPFDTVGFTVTNGRITFYPPNKLRAIQLANILNEVDCDVDDISNEVEIAEVQSNYEYRLNEAIGRHDDLQSRVWQLEGELSRAHDELRRAEQNRNTPWR